MSDPTISNWIQAARPKTLWAAVAPVVIGTVLAIEDESAHWLSAGAALLGAVLIQIGTNFANDYYDFIKGADQTDRLGPTRVTQAGLISPKQMRFATILVFTVALFVGTYLVWRGGWPIVIIGLVSILLGVLYTGGPVPIGYIGLGELFVLLFFGPVAVGGTYYVQALTLSSVPIIIGFAPGLFSVAILTVNNLRDIDSDRRAGKKTLAVRFGATYARLQYVLAIAAAILISLWLKFQSGRSDWALLPLLTLIAAFGSFKSVLSQGSGTKLNETLATTGKLLMLFTILFSIGWLL